MTSHMLPQDLSVRFGQASEAGVKPENEDCLGVQVPKGDLLSTKGVAIALADGVSAAEMGGRGSRGLCAELSQRLLQHARNLGGEDRCKSNPDGDQSLAVQPGEGFQ